MPRRLLLPLLAVAFLAVSCAREDHPVAPVPLQVPIGAYSPTEAVRVVEWAWKHQNVEVLDRILASDYQFQFAQGDSAGNAYRDAHKDELKNHILLLESDGGVFDPDGFGFTGSDDARAAVTAIGTLLKGLGASAIAAGGGGADIGPAAEAAKAPVMSHNVKGDYFLIHHTPADTIARITPKQVSDNAAAIAVMTYVVAERGLK